MQATQDSFFAQSAMVVQQAAVATWFMQHAHGQEVYGLRLCCVQSTLFGHPQTEQLFSC